MTKVRKILIVATILAASASGIYEAHQASALRTQAEKLRQQQVLVSEQIQQFQREREEASARAAILKDQNEQLRSDNSGLLQLRSEAGGLRNDSRELAALKAAEELENDPVKRELRTLLVRAALLKRRMAETPDARIPELQFAELGDWIGAVDYNELNTEESYRQAMASVRMGAEGKCAKNFASALRKYIRANKGQFPTGMSQLKPYLDPPVEEAILERYEFAPAKEFNVGPGDSVIVTKEPVDKKYDARTVIGATGPNIVYFDEAELRSKQLGAAGDTLHSAIQAYSKANYGFWPDDFSKLVPYLTTDEERAALETLLEYKKNHDIQ